ncbi:MAG: PEP-CTERM sorting domain-containing protein, partial [Tepidisphaeraceae bacterium]
IYTTLDDPLGVGRTYALGISSNNIVGFYFDASGKAHGFLYNGSTYTTIDDPLGVDTTQPNGISGNNIVGMYVDASNRNHGFLYDGSTYTTIDDPLAVYGTFPNVVNGTMAWGIDGNNIVGYYTDATGNRHGFIASTPEPPTLALLCAGAIGLAGYAWRRRRQKIAGESSSQGEAEGPAILSFPSCSESKRRAA